MTQLSREATPLALVAVLVLGCAHDPARNDTDGLPSAADVVVTVSENAHPPSDGQIGIFEICVGADGKIASARTIQPLASRPGYADALIGKSGAMYPTRPCTLTRVYCNDCNVQAVAAAMAAPPPPMATAGAGDGDEPPATPRPKLRNVSEETFDASRVLSPIPRLPDDFKIHHVGERLAFTAKVCAGADGRIAAITTLQGIPGADAAIVAAIRRWQLRPSATGNGTCTITRLVYEVSLHRR